MSDSFQTVTHRSWGSRLGESIKGVAVGLLFFVVSFPLLFWNEGRAVTRAQTLQEGSAAVVHVDSEKVEPGNESKLVHVSGLATTDESIADPEFGVALTALRLVREVEMYQWVESKKTEHRKKVGGGEDEITTYTYDTKWQDRTIDSSGFHATGNHKNPESMPYQEKEVVASRAHLGAFSFPGEFTKELAKLEPLPVDESMLANTKLKDRAKIHESQFYLGADPSTPEVGDVRVSFKALKPLTVSVVAQQVGNSFQDFQARAGGTIRLVEAGAMSAQQMFKAAEDENAMMTWILRLVGYLLMGFGIFLVLKPLSTVLDVIPFMGSFASFGLGLVSFLAAFALSLLTIAIGWLSARPILGITLLLAAGGAMAALVVVGMRARAKKAGAPAGVLPAA